MGSRKGQGSSRCQDVESVGNCRCQKCIAQENTGNRVAVLYDTVVLLQFKTQLHELPIHHVFLHLCEVSVHV